MMIRLLRSPLWAGKGVISVRLNIIPKQTAELAHACLNGDYQKGGAMQCRLMELIDALFIEVNPIRLRQRSI